MNQSAFFNTLIEIIFIAVMADELLSVHSQGKKNPNVNCQVSNLKWSSINTYNIF